MTWEVDYREALMYYEKSNLWFLKTAACWWCSNSDKRWRASVATSSTEIKLLRYVGWVVVRTLYVRAHFECILILSQYRVPRTGIMWEHLEVLATAWARILDILESVYLGLNLGRLYYRDLEWTMETALYVVCTTLSPVSLFFPCSNLNCVICPVMDCPSWQACIPTCAICSLPSVLSCFRQIISLSRNGIWAVELSWLRHNWNGNISKLKRNVKFSSIS